MRANRSTGCILAGGQSRRMGGGDKALIEVRGTTLLGHILDRFAPQVGKLIINANGAPDRFAPYGRPVVADVVHGHLGPLAGVLTAMRWSIAHAPEADMVATVSTDAPLFPDDLVARLTGTLQAGRPEIALAQSRGHLHPVIGVWPVALADDLEQALADGIRKVLQWTDRHTVHAVRFPDVRLGGGAWDPFFNVNTPEDLQKLAAGLGDHMPCPPNG